MFERALAFVLKWEGGYSDHPSDPGGATNMGVTQAVYDAWRLSKGQAKQDVRLITREEAAAIYKERYWDPLGVSNYNPALALIAFDAAVNHGLSAAKKWLSDSGGDWRKYAAIRIDYYTKIKTWPTFGQGWMRRMADCIKECASLDLPRRLFINGVELKPTKMTYTADKLYFKVEK